MAAIHSFELNGVDYGDSNHLVTVEDHRIDYPFRVNIVDLAQADGMVSQGTRFSSPIYTLDCALVASSPETRDTAWANVLQSLTGAHIAGITEFNPYFIEDVSETFYARPLDGPKDVQFGINGVRFSLKIILQNLPLE